VPVAHVDHAAVKRGPAAGLLDGDAQRHLPLDGSADDLVDLPVV
jgi:hypothetical protein